MQRHTERERENPICLFWNEAKGAFLVSGFHFGYPLLYLVGVTQLCISYNIIGVTGLLFGRINGMINKQALL